MFYLARCDGAHLQSQYSGGRSRKIIATSKSAYFTPYHAVHEDKFEAVFIKRLVPVPIIRGPDVTGDGRSDPGICVPITGVGQQRSLIIQQPGKDGKDYQQTQEE